VSWTDHRQAGLAAENAYKMTLAYFAIGFVGTVLAWFLMMNFGRRTIYVSGLAILTTIMFIIGFLSLAPESNKGAQWAVAVMLIIWVSLSQKTTKTRYFSMTLRLAQWAMQSLERLPRPAYAPNP